VLIKGNKLELRLELCYFVRYPKGTKSGYFNHPKEQKVFVNTYTRYLEDNQKMSASGSSQVELEKTVSFYSDQSNPIEEPNKAQPNISIQAEPRHSGRLTRILERWTGEIFDLISEHQEHDPIRYEEVIADLDTNKWLEAMSANIESMHMLTRFGILLLHLKG
jgi:hypothetical protein